MTLTPHPEAEKLIAIADGEVKATCAIAGVNYLPPDADPDGYPGGFDMTSLDDMRKIIAASRAQAEQPAPAVVGSVADASITLDLKMATELLEMFGGEPAEITLQIGDGHSGKGVYAHYTDMPEEGAEFLGMPDDEAIPSTQPHQIAEPASQGDAA